MFFEIVHVNSCFRNTVICFLILTREEEIWVVSRREHKVENSNFFFYFFFFNRGELDAVLGCRDGAT